MRFYRLVVISVELAGSLAVMALYWQTPHSAREACAMIVAVTVLSGASYARGLFARRS